MAHQHLALDSVSHLLDGNVGPVQVPGETICGAVAVTRAVSICVLEELLDISVSTFFTDCFETRSACCILRLHVHHPYKRSSPSLIAAIIHRKLICPPGAATFG